MIYPQSKTGLFGNFVLKRPFKWKYTTVLCFLMIYPHSKTVLFGNFVLKRSFKWKYTTVLQMILLKKLQDIELSLERRKLMKLHKNLLCKFCVTIDLSSGNYTAVFETFPFNKLQDIRL